MLRPVRLLAAVCVLAIPLSGQQEGPALPPSRLPSALQTGAPENPTNPPSGDLAKLTVQSDLVLVPVIVTDSSGRHVSGLPKEAFRIEENGKLRNVSIFEETQTETVPVRRKNGTAEGYSNFLLGNDHSWRITIVVLDMINTPWMRQLEAKKQLTNYLLRSALRDEPMAIFGLGSRGLRQLHPFTTDTRVLIDALQKLKLSLSSKESTQPADELTGDSSASDEEQLMSDVLNDLDATVSANYQRNATRQTLAGLTQLARALQAFPGRKTLIWATAGFPFVIDDPQSFARQGDDLLPDYEQAWRLLNSANIAVYPVDLSALDFSSASLPSANSSNGMKSALRLPYDKSVQQLLTLHAFANATGGRPCVTIDELEKCFAEAVDDSRSYYLLGYYLGSDTHPGWRKLKVKVAQEGSQARYRSEVYVAPKIPDTPELRRKELVEALASPVEYGAVRLNVRLLPPAKTPPSLSASDPKQPAEFMLEVMGNSITIDGEKKNAIDLQVTTVVFDGNRKSIASMSQVIATNLEPEMMRKTLQTGLGIPEKIDLPRGKYEVKFAVRDNLSGLLGTVSAPLDLN
jgi:VWFA-related protein